MNKSIIFVFLIVVVMLIAGCETREVVKVTCNKPYILVGTSCCLDKNDNSICDKDEVKEKPKVEVKEEPKEKDKCGNNVCDEEEDCESCQKDCGKCFSLSDLQADINKIIDWKIVLKKEKEDDITDYYLHSELRARLLGEYPPKGIGHPTDPYNFVLPKRYVLVSQIKDKTNYIKNSDEFYQYVVKNKDYILAPVKEAKNKFKEDFDDERLLKMIDIENYQLINISSADEKIYFDNITLMETVDNKIVEIVFVSTDDYKVNYKVGEIETPKIIEFSGINYEHIMSIYCSPNLIITIYPYDDYNKEDFNTRDVSDSYFFSDIIYDRKTKLVDATALVNMCEQRYEFTYLRYR